MAVLKLAAAAALLASGVFAGPDDPPVPGKMGLDGGFAGNGKKKRTVRQEPNDAIPQAPGTGPILAPGTYLQFPSRIQPRSMALGARRRAVMVTDGGIYQKVAPGLLPFGLASRKEPPVPYAYVVDGSTGKSLYNMAFNGRKALPYGIAEDPRDGRVAVTFYQSQTDSVEVWQPDLSVKLTYHDVSLKPSIPFFHGPGGEMWIPFTIADRFLEETDRVLQLYIYKKDGSREETFPRREWGSVKYPHTMRVDGAGRVWAAGLAVWAWEDGVHGPIPKTLNESMTPPVRIDVYGLTNDAASRGSPFVKEQRERWFEQNPGVEPSREMLASTNTRYALLPMASYPFPLTCQWPLFDLTGDGHMVAGCHDQDDLIVFRAYRPPSSSSSSSSSKKQDGASEMELLQALEEVGRFNRPLGITSLGAIAMDPSGKAFALLDTTRKRVYSVPWPGYREALAGDGEQGAPPFTPKAVSGITWHDMPEGEGAGKPEVEL